MRVLIYKRTHKGDPNETGIFGIQDCMGRIRNWNYDAVIGIGGESAWRDDIGIKYKINWIGLQPKRISAPKKRGDLIVFAHFKLYEETGINIEDHYPHLFEYLYSTKKRFNISSNLPEDVLKEVIEILDTIKDSPASQAYDIEIQNDLDSYIKTNICKCGGCSNSEKTKHQRN
ncbi:MAG: hypothetical protein KHZ60_10930 [Alistipes sp.]|jgi:hypothetical protein|uniref:hypothetical protein n=1 Tax=Bacteroidales TaxID=171549 RepID=UPI001D366BBC|nr:MULTISPECIES: hypothetical protein [Bacteroidales]MBS5020563.1 hypothetical protein [Alistipes sp.]